MNAPVRPPDAIDRAIATVPVRTDAVIAACREAESRAALDNAVIELMLRQKWRITRAIHGPWRTAIWPPCPGATAASELAVCRRKLAAQEAARRARHYAHDRNVMIGLRQAERALMRMVGATA